MKRKIFKSLTSLLLVVLLAFTSILPAMSAVNAGTKYAYKEKTSTGLSYTVSSYKSASGKTHNGYGTMNMYFLDKNHKEPIYCIQPYKSSAETMTAKKLTDSSYWKNELSGKAQNLMLLLGLYGYPNNGSTKSYKPYYIATQVLAWEIVSGGRTDTKNATWKNGSHKVTISLSDSAKAAYKEIVTDMANHDVVPSFVSTKSGNPTNIQLGYDKTTGTWRKTVTDTNKVLSKFTVNASGVTVTQSGNNLTVISKKAIPNGVTLTFTKKNTNVNTAVVLNPATDNQTMFYGAKSSPIKGYAKSTTVELGHLKIYKVVNDAGVEKPQGNVQFTITQSALGIKKTVKTNSKGIYEEDVVPGYTYTVKEIVPDGYKCASDNPQSLEIKAGQTRQFKFVNQEDAPGTIKVTKSDANTDAKLQGAQFGLFETYDAAQTHDVNNVYCVAAAITDSEGVAQFSSYEAGTVFYLAETSAPSGYTISTTIKKITIASGKTQTVDYTDTKTGVIQIVKRDKEDKSILLENAVFEIYKDSNCTDLLETVTTNKLGLATVEVPVAGTYYVKEIRAPSGYQLDNKVVPVEVNLETVNFESLSGPSSVSPKDEPGVYTGENYILASPDTNLMNELMGDSNEYTIAENGNNNIVVNRTLVNDNNHYTITINYNDATYVMFLDDAVTPNGLSSQQWYKKDGETYTTYQFQSVPDEIVNKKFAINAKLKTYIKEIGYSITQPRQKTTYDLSGKIKVKVNLEDISGNNPTVPYKGMPVDLYYDTKVIAHAFTDENGNCEFTGLINDCSYTVCSATLSEGGDIYTNYFLTQNITPSNDNHNIPAESDSSTVITLVNKYDSTALNTNDVIEYHICEFTNERIKVTLSKTDLTTGAPVQGAEITIYRYEEGSDEPVFYAAPETDENGNITLECIPVGSYLFKETTAPEGFALNTQEFQFTINYDADGNAVIEGDTQITDEPTKIVLYKFDNASRDAETKIGLGGAEFTFYTLDGIEVGTATSNNEGEAVITKLPAGEYYYVETKAPEGYYLNYENGELKKEFISLNEDGTVTGETEVYDDATTITLTKVDEDDNPLSDAVIALYTEEGEFIDEYITDEDGLVQIDKLKVGHYIFTETQAPDGYILDSTEYDFTILDNGDVEGTTRFVNRPIVVTITKVDSTNHDKKLKGAKLLVYDESGECINSKDNNVTNKDGEIVLEKIPVGDYTIREKKAPSGYKITKEEFKFSVYEDGTVKGTTMVENAPVKHKTPTIKTGSIIAIVAIITSGLGLTLVFLKKKMKK